MISSIKNKLTYAFLAIPAYAEDKIDIGVGKNDNFKGLEGLSVPSIVSGAISLAILLVALVFFFILILGGLKWVMSGGDEKNVAAARSQITNALIGLAIVFAAFAIMKLIEIVFGVSLLGGLTIPHF